MPAVEELKRQVVVANRIMANEGIIQGFGHVSARVPDSDQILISRSLSPAFVTEDDILTLTLDGDVVDDTEQSPYLETVIHRAIYRHREDVGGVVHHHAQEIMPFTITDIEMKPAYHMAAPFSDGVPKFSSYDTAYGRMVVTEAEGDRMAENLGEHTAQLLESHGANVTGPTIKEATLLTMYFVTNARYQWHAELLGSPTYYTGPSESIDAVIEDVVNSDIAIDRMWNYLTERLPDDPTIPDVS